jgi:hypothetical protein
MEVATGRAKLVEFADDGASAALATIARSEIEDALLIEDGPPELVLDVSRNPGNADEQTGQIFILWGKDELEEVLRRAEGDSVRLAFDPEALAQTFDADVEGHGLREVAAVLAVAVAAGTAAGVASARPDVGTGTGVSGSATIEQVRADAGAAPGATIEAVRSAEGVQTVKASGGEPIAAGIEAVRSTEAATLAAAQGPFDIEGVRLAQGSELLASEAAPAAAGIEAVRSAATTGGLTAVEGVEAVRSTEIAASLASAQSASSIEGVRSAAAEAARATSDTDGGISISMPSPEVTGALGGAVALLITGAAFAARRQRPMRPA